MAYRVRPFAAVFLRARNPGFSRLLHDAVRGRHTILTIQHNAQRLAQILLRIERLRISIEFFPTHGHGRIVRQHRFTAGENSMALRAQTLHIAP
ncbi:hypothetical protein D3C87_1622470 [compost metagenome]